MNIDKERTTVVFENAKAECESCELERDEDQGDNPNYLRGKLLLHGVNESDDLAIASGDLVDACITHHESVYIDIPHLIRNNPDDDLTTILEKLSSMQHNRFQIFENCEGKVRYIGRLGVSNAAADTDCIIEIKDNMIRKALGWRN